MATLGVTIGIGKKHAFYAEQAARRVRQHLGLETFILSDEHFGYALEAERFQHRVWSLKFSIFEVIPGHWDRVMYFDADWRPVRDWDVDTLFPDRDGIYAAPYRSHKRVVKDLEDAYGLVRGTYFNSGWIVLPRSAKPLLDEARRRYNDLPNRFGDQCILNQVLARKVTPVSQAFNVMVLDEWPDPANAMAVHSVFGKWNYKVYDGESEDRNWNFPTFADSNETILRNLDYAHNWTTAADHIVEVYLYAAHYAGGKALDIGSFRGHSALALALAGLDVTSYDRDERHQHERVGLIARFQLNVDFRLARGNSELDSPDMYDVVLHDAQHGDRIRPELEAFWHRKVKPGGLLIVHDVEQLNLQSLVQALEPDGYVISQDDLGRQMGYFCKARISYVSSDHEPDIRTR